MELLFNISRELAITFDNNDNAANLLFYWLVMSNYPPHFDLLSASPAPSLLRG